MPAEENAPPSPPDIAQLAAQLGHEIRTPLAGVISLTELVLSSELGERQRKLLGMALQSARQLLDLVNHQLDLAKLDAGAMELAPRAFALHDCLRDALQPLLPSAHAKGVTLQARVQPGVPHRLVADELRLRQVLSNLVGNALKFTERGQVRVDVQRLPGQQPDALRLVLAVTDTGIGMDATQLQRLFKPFAQAEATTSQRYGGSGLGLVISQRLVRLMGGGAIQVESETGIGSCFRFEIDCQREPA
jgi:signal transduction histidine kinase